MKRIKYKLLAIVGFLPVLIFSSCASVTQTTAPTREEIQLPVEVQQIQIAPPKVTVMGNDPDAAKFISGHNEFQLEQALQEAIQRNPELLAAFADFEAKLQKIPQVKSLPDPTVNYDFFIEEIQTRNGQQDFFAGISQKLPWFGKLTLKGKIADADAQAALENYRTKMLDVIRDVSHAYHNLAFQQSAHALAKEEKQYLNQFLESAMAAYAGGKSSRQEVLKSQTEISRVDTDLLGYPARIQTLQAQLNRLMNRDDKTTLSVSTYPYEIFQFVNEKNRLATALQNRPELNRIQKMIEKSEKQYELARKDFWPDVTLGVNYFGIGDNPAASPRNEGDDAWNVTFGFNIPLRNSRRQAQLKEAEKLQQKYIHEKETVADRINEQHQSITSRLKSLTGQLHIMQGSLLPLAGEMFAASQADYTAGKGKFLDLLDAERTLLRVRLSEYKLLRDFNLAIADLERAVGTRFQSKAIVTKEEQK